MHTHSYILLHIIYPLYNSIYALFTMSQVRN